MSEDDAKFERIKAAAESLYTAVGMPNFVPPWLASIGAGADAVHVYLARRHYHCPVLDKAIAEGVDGVPVKVIYTGRFRAEPAR